MYVKEHSWPRGHETLIAVLFRDCNAFIDCDNVWCREGSFLYETCQESLCNSLWLDLKTHAYMFYLGARLLTRLIRKKRKKVQITNIRNEGGDFYIDP